MAILTPQYLDQWQPGVTIQASQVRAEFIQVYNALNGGLGPENLASNAVTRTKIAAGAITDDHIESISAAKITGSLSPSQLPNNLLLKTGGEITGSLVLNTGSPYLKSYSDNRIVLFEAGTGANKTQLIINPSGSGSVFEIIRNGETLLYVAADGRLVPKKLVIPVV